MAPSPPDGKPDRDLVLSGVLKALRNHRRMTVQQVADGMGLQKRSYERFEAGEGLLKMERIFSFARATDTDPYALMASAKLGAPDFAVACADNKIVMLFVAHARVLFGRQGGDMHHLQPQFIVEVLTAAFAALETDLVGGRELSEKWLQQLRTLAAPPSDEKGV